ncbi:MAG: hypothetical protein II723_07260 [Oscillospiraceae bacterium]|nr:hypothetical protein [Oscillospiraceae bacterium]
MKQNEWFEATSRIAEQYITEAKPRHPRTGSGAAEEFRLTEELPDVRSRQSRITHWVTTGFATAAALAVVIGGGVLISKMRNKVPTKPAESIVTTVGTVVSGTEETTETTDDDGFQAGHTAGAAAANAAIEAGIDKVYFSGSITDTVQDILDDNQDADMKYVVLGRNNAFDYARVIHVSRALADNLKIGTHYQFTIDERITEVNPALLRDKRDLYLSCSSAKAVSSDYMDTAGDDITFSRAETESGRSAEFLTGYQEGYRDVVLNPNLQYDFYKLSGSLTAYIRGVYNPDVSGDTPEAQKLANCLVIAESPDHKSVFPVYYPYTQRAELVKGQLVTFLADEAEDHALYLSKYLSSAQISDINPSAVNAFFNAVRTPQAGEENNWNRLKASLSMPDSTTDTTADAGHSDETTTTPQDIQDDNKLWELGELPFGYRIGWSFCRSGSELHLEQYNETDTNPHSAQLNGGGTAVTHMTKTKTIGEIYTNSVPASDGEKAYILKDGQVISTDGSRVLMTGIRTSAGQHFSLYSVEKLSNDCWFVRMTEGWENGGGWVNEYWCDGKGKSVQISVQCTPSYTVLISEDKSCVYYVDEFGIFRANRFEKNAVKLMDGEAILALKSDDPETYVATQYSFLKNNVLYIPVMYNSDGSDTDDVITLKLDGDMTPQLTTRPLDYLFRLGGKIYGITKDGVKLAEYQPETGTVREIANLRSAYAAAAKDGANAAEKAALTELSQHGRITSIGAVWEDLIVVTVTDQTFAAINPLTGGVQILRW